jgi:hypothetical protein
MPLGTTPDRVIHRHRIGEREFARVSQLIYVGERPMAVLSWLHQGEQTIPGVCVELDRSRLQRGSKSRLFVYHGVTVDPRYEPVGPEG